MSRTTLLKVGYLFVLLVIFGLAWQMVRVVRPLSAALVLTALLLFLPGRILGFYWRDFFRGRQLLSAGRHAEAEEYFLRFLASLEARPTLRHLVWFAWPIYSLDARVMTLTNLGAARLQRGALDDAEPPLRDAARLDPLAPLPWHNLGLLSSLRGEPEAAAAAYAKARELGYAGRAVDQTLMDLSAGLARLEG